MFDLDEQPTTESITTITGHLAGIWQTSHTKWSKMDMFYKRTYSIWPEGLLREGYRPSTPTNIIDHAADNQLAYTPRFHRFPRRQGEGENEKSDKIERWLSASFEEMALEEPMLTWKQIGKYLVLYGYAVVEGPVLALRKRPVKRTRESQTNFAKKLEEFEAEKTTGIPFRMRSPHPMSILLPPFEKRPSFAIKKSKRYAYEVAEQVGRKGQTRKNVAQFPHDEDKPFELVEVVELWTQRWHGYMAKGELLYSETNTWGFVPFAHAFAGFGSEQTDGEGQDPAQLAVGILEPTLDSIVVQAQSRSAQHNALMQAAYQKRGARGDAANLAEQLSRMDIVEMEPGDLWWLDSPQLPAWMFQADMAVDRDIETGSYARILAGLREPGVSTVGQQAILSTSATRKFSATMKQLEHLASIAASNLLRLVEVLGENVTTRGQTIGPDEIGGDYNVQATFQIIDPVLQLQQRELGMREVRERLKSKETYWAADAQLEDASGEQRRLLEDLVRSHPLYIELAARAVAAGMGLAGLTETVSAETAAAGGSGVSGSPIDAAEAMRQPITATNPVAPGQGQPRVPPQGI